MTVTEITQKGICTNRQNGRPDGCGQICLFPETQSVHSYYNHLITKGEEKIYKLFQNAPQNTDDNLFILASWDFPANEKCGIPAGESDFVVYNVNENVILSLEVKDFDDPRMPKFFKGFVQGFKGCNALLSAWQQYFPPDITGT